MTEALRHRRALIAMLAALSLVIVACGDDDDTTTSDATDDTVDQTEDGAEDEDDEDATEADTVGPEETDDGDVAALSVTTVDYAFEGLPESIASGTAIELTNASEVELHELVAIRLPDDEQRPVAELVQLPPDEIGPLVAGMTDVIVAPPGEAGFAVEGDGVLDEPGRYALICMIPTGIDPAVYLEAAQQSEGGPPQIDGAGPPHIVQGMFAEAVVE